MYEVLFYLHALLTSYLLTLLLYIFFCFLTAIIPLPLSTSYLISFCGILLGPPLANIVPNPESLVLIGEIG